MRDWGRNFGQDVLGYAAVAVERRAGTQTSHYIAVYRMYRSHFDQATRTNPAKYVAWYPHKPSTSELTTLAQRLTRERGTPFSVHPSSYEAVRTPTPGWSLHHASVYGGGSPLRPQRQIQKKPDRVTDVPGDRRVFNKTVVAPAIHAAAQRYGVTLTDEQVDDILWLVGHHSLDDPRGIEAGRPENISRAVQTEVKYALLPAYLPSKLKTTDANGQTVEVDTATYYTNGIAVWTRPNRWAHEPYLSVDEYRIADKMYRAASHLNRTYLLGIRGSDVPIAAYAPDTETILLNLQAANSMYIHALDYIRQNNIVPQSPDKDDIEKELALDIAGIAAGRIVNHELVHHMQRVGEMEQEFLTSEKTLKKRQEIEDAVIEECKQRGINPPSPQEMDRIFRTWVRKTLNLVTDSSINAMESVNPIISGIYPKNFDLESPRDPYTLFARMLDKLNPSELANIWADEQQAGGQQAGGQQAGGQQAGGQQGGQSGGQQAGGQQAGGQQAGGQQGGQSGGQQAGGQQAGGQQAGGQQAGGQQGGQSGGQQAGGQQAGGQQAGGQQGGQSGGQQAGGQQAGGQQAGGQQAGGQQGGQSGGQSGSTGSIDPNKIFADAIRGRRKQRGRGRGKGPGEGPGGDPIDDWDSDELLDPEDLEDEIEEDLKDAGVNPKTAEDVATRTRRNHQSNAEDVRKEVENTLQGMDENFKDFLDRMGSTLRGRLPKGRSSWWGRGRSDFETPMNIQPPRERRNPVLVELKRHIEKYHTHTPPGARVGSTPTISKLNWPREVAQRNLPDRRVFPMQKPQYSRPVVVMVDTSGSQLNDEDLQKAVDIIHTILSRAPGQRVYVGHWADGMTTATIRKPIILEGGRSSRKQIEDALRNPQSGGTNLWSSLNHLREAIQRGAVRIGGTQIPAREWRELATNRPAAVLVITDGHVDGDDAARVASNSHLIGNRFSEDAPFPPMFVLYTHDQPNTLRNYLDKIPGFARRHAYVGDRGAGDNE